MNGSETSSTDQFALSTVYDLRPANWKDIWFYTGIFLGISAFFLIILFLNNTGVVLSTVTGHAPVPSDYVVVGVVLFLVAFMIGLLVFRLRDLVSASLLVGEAGVAVERRGRIVHSWTWSGSPRRIVLGDPRVPQGPDTPPNVTPSLSPPNKAFIQVGRSVFERTWLTDEAYAAILRESSSRGIRVERSIVAQPVKGGVYYYLKLEVG